MPQPEAENQALKGIEAANNFQWEKSDEIFQKMAEQNADDFQGNFYLSRSRAWAYLSNKSKADYNEFFKYSDLALKNAEKKLDSDPDNETARFILGMAYNYRGVVYGKAESYVNAIWAFQKSNSYLKDLVAKNGKFYDAYLGLGIINVALGDIPGAFKWALSVAGLSSDKNAGINYLKTAAHNGYYLKAEAQYYLSQVYADNLLNYKPAEDYLRGVTARYPNNILFQYSYAAVLMKERKLNEAETVLFKIVKTDPGKKFRQVVSYANFSLGDIFYRKNDFTKAIEYYNRFLKTNSFREYTGIASLRLGAAYEINGDRNSAVKFFERALRGNQDYEEDVFAKRKGEVFRNRTIAETEIKVIKGGNQVEAGNYNNAFSILKEALSQIKTDKLKAEAYLYLSDAAFETGKYSEAADYAVKIKSLNLQEEQWIYPFACYYEARARFKSGDISAAKRLLKEADNRNSHDFEKKLKILINNLIITIN
jgi:tetratricopeptide (TPR) repeat protein